MPLERLSATDEAFLAIEDRGMPMHVGILMVLDGRGLLAGDGRLDVPAFRARVGAAMARVPRFRQRVEHVRGLGRAWVDDDGFDLSAHLTHIELPPPADHDALMQLAGNVFAPPLDRGRPLFRICTVSGLERDRVAILLAAHHAMVDGVGGIGALATMLTGSDDRADTAAPDTTARARSPSRLAIAGALAADHARSIAAALRALREELRDRGAAPRDASTIGSGFAHTVTDAFTPARRTALNPKHLSSRRGFEGVRLDLARADEIRHALGGTINDVVLATVSGALRRYLGRRGDVDRIRRFRALVPADLRSRTGPLTGGARALGNEVSFLLAPLPIAEGDPGARYDAVRAATAELKRESHEIESTAWFERLADVIAPKLVEIVFRVAARVRAFHVVVTNIRGPRTTLQLGPARVEETYGLVPLFEQQALGVVVLSYGGGLFFGLHTDADAVADPRELARDLEAAFDELAAIAAARRPAASSPSQAAAR